MTTQTLKLVRYQGKVWYWYGRYDYRGLLILDSIREDGTGTLADPIFAHELGEEETARQLAAIQYFQGVNQ